MPRAEFATFRNGSIPAEPSLPATTVPDLAPVEATLRLLLVESDAEAAARVRALLHQALGGRLVSDWVGDRDEAAALIVKHPHDLYLCAAGMESGLIASLRTGGPALAAPVIVIGERGADAAADLRAMDLGASDYIPADELTPSGLRRAIRHALAHQLRAAAAQHEIESLTSEKMRLNLLRDANHRFVENACHDFRSPLTVIKEFASIISEGLAGDVNEEQLEFLGIILTRVDQLSQMVDGILDASRLESDLIGVRREAHSVAALVDHVRATLEQSAATHKVAITFALDDDLPTVFADIESVGRVIVNLGANAAKYAGENGTIRVWAHASRDRPEVTIGVTDSGPGIAPEHVKLIFDRFQQVPDDKKANGGFGLGLHIASEFVRVNFGKLTVESAPDKGSTFSFTLPVFDINSLIPLHFGFLKTSRHSFQNVGIAVASAEGSTDETTNADVERLLNRQLRSYDLLLRLRPGSWLVCLACDQEAVGQITDRISEAYLQSSMARPDRMLPRIGFRTIGTWSLTDRPADLSTVIGAGDLSVPDAKDHH
jgi:signal transduction histidine kinase